MNSGTIAIIGAGKGGLAFLKVLINIRSVKIKYVCDTNPSSYGMLFAEEHGINCVTDYKSIIADPEVNLIFESTGKPEVFSELNRLKNDTVSLIGSSGAMTVFSIIDRYNDINEKLKTYKSKLEARIIERTEELEGIIDELQKEKSAFEKLTTKLQEINDEKTKYLVHTTHQLKAPFAAIQNYVDIILEGYTGAIEDQTKDILIKVKARCGILSTAIKEMLELANLNTTPESEFVKSDQDLHKMVASVIQRFNIHARTKGIKITYSASHEEIYYKCVEKLLYELFSVLIENAINYSKPDTMVEVHLNKLENGNIYFEVKDQGIGISEENVSRIFKEFFRANNAVSFQNSGTGLGLAIADKIAGMHNTKILVNSELDKGSTFSVTFS